VSPFLSLGSIVCRQ